jgi:hypothetical protein
MALRPPRSHGWRDCWRALVVGARMMTGKEPHHDLRPEGRRLLRGRIQDCRRRRAFDLDPTDRGTRHPTLPRADAVRLVRAGRSAGLSEITQRRSRVLRTFPCFVPPCLPPRPSTRQSARSGCMKSNTTASGASLIVSSRFAHATICARAACASASPHYDPDSRRSHGRRGLSLSLAGLLLMGLELASLPLAKCCVARNAIERCTA